MQTVGTASGRGRSKKAASTPRGGRTKKTPPPAKKAKRSGAVVEYREDENATKRQKRIDRELVRIYAMHGELTPEIVLEHSSNPKAALHKEFEWNDSAAARAFRVEQARNLIKASRYLAIVKGQEANEPPKIARVRRFASAGVAFRYLPREQVISEEELREKMVNERLGALRSWCTSVIDVPELTQLRRGIEKLLRGK